MTEELINTTHTSSQKAEFYLVLVLSQQSFALPLTAVQRVVHAVAVTRLPKATPIVCGLINYKGQIIPVLNMANRFLLPEDTIKPEHYFVIVFTATKHFALVADAITGVIQQSCENIISQDILLPGVPFLSGVMKLENGLMLIPDLDKLLTDEEQQNLDSLLKQKIILAENA